ncbi:MAG: hypothetical protein LBI94_03005 [Treponema sp.]|jgi:hypothetical protein|nr:hypothetical protein [Treponema sp.]
MRSLLNLIFENLIPIIIVVSVVIRIIAGVKKSAASRSEAAPAVPDNRSTDSPQDEEDVWSRLMPDDEEDEAPPQEVRPLLMPAPSLGSPAFPASPGPSFAQPFAPVTIAIEPAVPDRAEAAEPDGETPQSGPLDRLNGLPLLRRAIVLAEILGPPKGLDTR